MVVLFYIVGLFRSFFCTMLTQIFFTKITAAPLLMFLIFYLFFFSENAVECSVATLTQCLTLIQKWIFIHAEKKKDGMNLTNQKKIKSHFTKVSSTRKNKEPNSDRQ